MRRADFTYRDCDSHVFITPQDERARRKLSTLAEGPLRVWTGGHYDFPVEEALTLRHLLRQAGYIVRTV